VYLGDKKHYLGLYGSPESHVAYARLLAELKADPAFCTCWKNADKTVREVAVAFLDHAKRALAKANYAHYSTTHRQIRRVDTLMLDSKN
jgi:hypothetical protein